MALYTWNETYSVHVKKFDEQHQGLFACINELNDAMKARHANTVIRGILLRLVQYTKKHFSEEEAAMARVGWPGLVTHKVEHRNLVAKVEEFVKRFEAGELILSVSLIYFLTDWLKNHIAKTDKGYSDFMNEHGVN